MFSSEKALHVGLVDQLSEPDKLLDDTQTEMAKWLKTSGKYCIVLYCIVLYCIVLYCICILRFEDVKSVVLSIEVHAYSCYLIINRKAIMNNNIK